MANNKDQDDLQDGSVDQGDEEFYDDQDDAGHEGDLGEDSGDENWEEDESSASSAKGEGKKKSSLSTMAIIAGGVVVGLVILYLQFGGSGGQTPPPEGMGGEPIAATDPVGIESPPQPAAPQQADVQGQEPAPVAPSSPDQGSPNSLEALRDTNGAAGIETVDPAVKAASMEKDPRKQTPQGGFMNDPSLLPSEVQGVAPPVVDRPVEPTMTAPSKRPPAVAEVENPVTPVSDFPTVDAIKKPDAGGVVEQPVKPLEEPVGTEAPVVATPTPAPVQSTMVETSSEEVKVLKTQLETALKRIEDLEKKSDQPVVAAPATPSEDVKALRAALESLQNKVETLSAEKEALQKKEPEMVSESPRTEEKRPTKVSSPSKKAEPREVPKTKKSVVWDLKGAMPGQAMIAVHGERDLKMIRIGDEVAGIGRVTAIENSGKGWVVQGTTGQIRQ